jgi:hypothetical protein
MRQLDRTWWKQLGFTLGWLGAALVLGALMHVFLPPAHARPNAAWEAMRVQAEAECSEELFLRVPQDIRCQARRRLRYISQAGTVACIPNTHCQYGGTFVSCCGEADAYEADDTWTDEKGNTWAVLTCNDPDDCREVPNKITRKPGERFRVPPERVLLKDRPRNDTNHGWVWISTFQTDADGAPAVLCWTGGGLY